MASSTVSRPSGGFAFPNDKMAIGYITRGAPEIQFVESLMATYEFDRYVGPGRFLRHPWRIGLRGHVNVSRGRCRMVREFLKGSAQWLLMVDDDMGWAPQAHEQLLASVAAVAAEGPLEPWQVVMGGLTFGWLPDGNGIAPVMYGRDSNGMFIREDPPQLGKGIRQVGGTGAAFLLAHRRMFELIEAETPPTQAPWFQEIEVPIVDEWDDEGNATHATTYWVSEDLWFCDRVYGVGGKVFVAQHVEIDHKKQVLLNRRTFEDGDLVIA